MRLKGNMRWVLCGLLGIVCVCVVLPLLNYLAYEVQPKVDLLRQSIGSQVVVETDSSLLFDRYEGRLESVRYRVNDVVGFFDLNIEIHGKCGGSLGLRPWELDRITIVEAETGGNAEGGYETPEAVFQAWKRAIQENDSALFLSCYSQEDEKWVPFLKDALKATRKGIYVRDRMRLRFGENAWAEFADRITPKPMLPPITDSRIQTELERKDDGSFWVVKKAESLMDRHVVLDIVPRDGRYFASLGITGTTQALANWVNPQLKGLWKLREVVDSAPNLDEMARVYTQAYNEELDRIEGKETP